jgi:stringent starvation protein B
VDQATLTHSLSVHGVQKALTVADTPLEAVLDVWAREAAVDHDAEHAAHEVERTESASKLEVTAPDSPPPERESKEDTRSGRETTPAPSPDSTGSTDVKEERVPGVKRPLFERETVKA